MIMTSAINTIDDLEQKLMMEIGLSVDLEHTVTDQDFGTYLSLHGKYIKAKRNGIEPFVNRHSSIYFDPVRNVKFMRYLFQYYMTKIQKLDNRYFSVFFPTYNQETGAGCIDIKNETESYRSKYYYNEALRYIDIIFRISGEEIDLTKFDSKVR